MKKTPSLLNHLQSIPPFDFGEWRSLFDPCCTMVSCCTHPSCGPFWGEDHPDEEQFHGGSGRYMKGCRSWRKLECHSHPLTRCFCCFEPHNSMWPLEWASWWIHQWLGRGRMLQWPSWHEPPRHLMAAKPPAWPLHIAIKRIQVGDVVAMLQVPITSLHHLSSFYNAQTTFEWRRWIQRVLPGFPRVPRQHLFGCLSHVMWST